MIMLPERTSKIGVLQSPHKYRDMGGPPAEPVVLIIFVIVIAVVVPGSVAGLC